jgi:hypothetical protein
MIMCSLIFLLLDLSCCQWKQIGTSLLTVLRDLSFRGGEGLNI